MIENHLKNLSQLFTRLRKLFVIVILLLIISSGIYGFLYDDNLSIFWMYFLLIRSLGAFLILLLILYNFIKLYIYKRYDVNINIKFIDSIFIFYDQINIQFINFIQARNKFEEDYYPDHLKKFNKRKRLDVDRIIILFVVLYFLINVFFIEHYLYLKIYFNIFFSLFTIYLGILTYMDLRYLIPNMNKFIKVDSYFCLSPSGPSYGPVSFGQVRKTIFRTYTVVSPLVRLCMTCIGAVAMLSLGYSEYFPESRSPAARIGDVYNYYMDNATHPADNLPK